MHNPPPPGDCTLTSLTSAPPTAVAPPRGGETISDSEDSASTFTSLAAENRQLRAELDQLRAERFRLLAARQDMMDLLGVSDPQKVMHALRNVLNERALYRALADLGESSSAEA